MYRFRFFARVRNDDFQARQSVKTSERLYTYRPTTTNSANISNLSSWRNPCCQHTKKQRDDDDINVRFCPRVSTRNTTRHGIPVIVVFSPLSPYGSIRISSHKKTRYEVKGPRQKKNHRSGRPFESSPGLVVGGQTGRTKKRLS